MTIRDVLHGGGEMGALMRSIDWSKTAVGPVDSWPQSLRTALSILLDTGFPMYIAWGPEFTQFYNDGYRPILGTTKHPSAMGASTRDTFAEIWHIIGPMFEGVMRGVATNVHDFLLPLDRHGFAEECYFIFSYSPIRQENGEVGGVLVTVTETTQRVLGERRLKTSQALAARTRDARAVTDACAIAADVLAEDRADIPFASIYLVAPDGSLVLERSSGEPADGPMLDLPIVAKGLGTPIGRFVAGLSPRLMLDEAYRDYLALVASQIGTAIESARALEEAQARADALAELDRAKTAFFNNVSHEFRTPLTLLLGPTAQALGSPAGTLAGDDLEIVHRNGLRLLKLVNTLLDFSRLEAGRVQATFAPTDLAAVTADLASAFRSATERAGLDLVVECPPLPEPVYVDRDLWEKVVLNLVSNAFKFTSAGSIHVGIAWRGSHAELTVRDTGIGIPPGELDRVFERFHRVERVQARTHEGSGIGLSLVRELVHMHGGTIRVESEPGRGSTFIVTIPAGNAHLPAERVGAAADSADTVGAATPYVQEALRWLPSSKAPQHESGSHPASAQPASGHEARVLVADDNADMRDYVERLLADRWTVEAVADGAQALEAVRRAPPDAIVADVMMPGMDGFELLRALRGDPQLRTIPVLLLSARAGEEARIDGLDAGADDYLVKPFVARELVARVQALIVRGQVRSVEEAHAVRLASIFQHAPVGVAIMRGPEHTFEFANDAYLDLVGRRPILGQAVHDALPELEGQGIYELLDTVYASGQPYIGRSLPLLVDRGGAQPEEMVFDFVYQPLIDGGRVTGTAAVCFDVSELVRAREAAESASRAKDEFLAMLGHELRNPLAPILTALQLMRLRGLTGADKERTIIERQVRHVVGLVDDLLDISRITRGTVQLRQEHVDLADLVGRSIEMTAPAIEERRHNVKVDVPSGLTVTGDPARLAQIFANLLSNAAKYTDPGGVIRVAGAREGDEVAISVFDNGSGIEPSMLPRIFDLFTQERQNIDRSAGGLGIGLAIVQSLVKAHGGTVSVASEGRGSGSTFTVRLPFAVTPAATRPVETPAAAVREGRRVLVVDDNRDAAEVLADSLRAMGHTVRRAHDGPDALEVLDGFLPDVVLLDLGLPVMDGFELAARLRADDRFAGVGLFAVTGYGQQTDRQRTEAAGFNVHLVKPVDVQAVDAAIRAWRAETTA
ncbi:MAG: ATP-binding protein [Vicinamibacterales bacterium]